MNKKIWDVSIIIMGNQLFKGNNYNKRLHSQLDYMIN